MLLGNPIIFFSALGFMSLFVLAALVAAMRRQRALPAFPWGGDASWTATQTACFWLLAGWGLHYLPFYTMPRVLYFHHYMPAHLFSCMFLGVFLDYLVRIRAFATHPLTHNVPFKRSNLGTAWASTLCHSKFLVAAPAAHPLMPPRYPPSGRRLGQARQRWAPGRGFIYCC